MKAPEPAAGAVDVQIAPAFAELVNTEALVAAAQATLAAEGQQDCRVTLVITDDEGIRELNRAFAGNDTPTDVLSFSAREGSPEFVLADSDEEAYLGDIIISFPFAVAQASARNLPVARELALLAIHGTLHLLGYDHATSGDEARMWTRQDDVLQALGYEPTDAPRA
ncbi:MAG: rRNA maturation RNase YbeY [Anaerolineae bacterium]|nr:rRNA maturation RNase YbeY [Anaerolineae bacterium]